MGRKPKLDDITPDLTRMKASTPLQKREDVLTAEDIIKNDEMMFQIHFMSEMMMRNKTNKEIQEAYLEKFNESITNYRISVLKKYVRAVYVAEVLHNRDEMVAEELMHANWELTQLKEYWERTKSGKRKIERHKANSVGTDITTYDLDETTENFEETFGDLNALKQIGVVRERIIKVLGLEAPKQQTQDNTKPNAITINIVDAAKPRTVVAEDVEPDID